MFDRVSILSAGWGTTSLRRSIEQPFDVRLDLEDRGADMTATQTRTAFQPLAPAPLRLTRRGKAVLLGLLALLLLVAVSVGRTGSQAAMVTENGPALQQTTVQPGDTLWSVAQRIAPDNDPRQVVAQIKRINHLHGSALQAGQLLLLPTAAR
jgi:Tfp pilus assembly protein FimV